MSKTKIVIFYTVKVSRSTDRILQRVPMILAAILVSFESRDSIPPRNQSPKTFPLPKTQKINPHGYSEVASNDHSSPHHPSFHLSFQCGLYFSSTSYTRGQGQCLLIDRVLPFLFTLFTLLLFQLKLFPSVGRGSSRCTSRFGNISRSLCCKMFFGFCFRQTKWFFGMINLKKNEILHNENKENKN